MRLADAQRIMAGGAPDDGRRGYRVAFEHVDGSILRSDHFPERNEAPIEDEEVAWEMAGQFARATFNKCVNIYVVDESWCPVVGYDKRIIRNRAPVKVSG